MPQKSVSDFKPTGIAIDHCYYSDRDIQAIISAAGRLPQGNVEHGSTSKDGKRLIAKTVERRTALEACLKRAAQTWAVDSQFQTRPTAKQLSDSLAAIESTANKLLEKLQLPNEPDSSDLLAPMPYALRFDGLQAVAAEEAENLGGFPEHTGEGLLAEAVRGVYRLRGWAHNADPRKREETPENQEGISTPRKERHVADAALNELIGSLCRIWADIFDREIRTSVGGPMSANKGRASGPMLRFLKACLEPLPLDSVPSKEAIRGIVRRIFG